MSSGPCYYMPHPPVISDNHDTTKLGVVFHESAKTNGPSLNECPYKGQQLTPMLLVNVLRF